MVAEQKDEARVYLRRSETKQEMSLHDQLRIALGRAAELGVSSQATPADIDHMQSRGLLRYKDLYLDDGLKGDDLERPAFKQMCEELQSSDTVGWLFCVRRDRLGRPQDIDSFEMALTEIRFAVTASHWCSVISSLPRGCGARVLQPGAHLVRRVQGCRRLSRAAR